ncbi:unnamed protein product [Moneuplotes crassus]|uniref:Ankyrin repeat protein n=1 Tax=Euplotes crassus TaxID=5936 RepID=A0AAD1XXF2_EUPCR|nr:unnamed protein product [Moneuplotes crassus]
MGCTPGLDPKMSPLCMLLEIKQILSCDLLMSELVKMMRVCACAISELMIHDMKYPSLGNNLGITSNMSSIACFEGDSEIVNRILTKPNSVINLNLKNKLGLTALDRAIEGKREEIIKILLNDVRCNVNTGGGEKRSALNFAVHILSPSATKSILNSSKFIDFNIVDDKGNNVFHILFDKYCDENSQKCTQVLEMLFKSISPSHQYLFTQYNQNMLSPLHCAVRSRNKLAVAQFLTLIKQNNYFSEKITSIPVGFDEYPLIHFFGITLKSYESEYILRKHPEINIMARDNRGIPAILFEYFCNNNIDNHKRWFLFKHLKRIYSAKFLKPQRSYKRIVHLEREFTRVTRMAHKQSEYHTYTKVLTQKYPLVRNRVSHFKKTRKHFKKMLQKEIENDYIEEICVEFSEEKTQPLETFTSNIRTKYKKKCEKYTRKFHPKESFSDTEDEHFSSTKTAAGFGSLNNFLNNMMINPKNKIEIDMSQDLLVKTENISINPEEHRNSKDYDKEMTCFSKLVPKIINSKQSLRLNSLNTQFRDHQGSHRVMAEKNLLDPSVVDWFKENLIRRTPDKNALQKLPSFCIADKISPNIEEIWGKLYKILETHRDYYIQVPIWETLIGILIVCLLSNKRLANLEKIIKALKCDQPEVADSVTENSKWLISQLELVLGYHNARAKLRTRKVKSRNECNIRRNTCVIKNQLPKSIFTCRRPYNRRNNIFKIHSALDMYENKSFQMPMQKYRNKIIRERSTIGPKDKIECKTLSQVKEMSQQAKSARLIKPRQKHIPDSFLFNNGVGFNVPNLGIRRRNTNKTLMQRNSYQAGNHLY